MCIGLMHNLHTLSRLIPGCFLLGGARVSFIGRAINAFVLDVKGREDEKRCRDWRYKEMQRDAKMCKEIYVFIIDRCCHQWQRERLLKMWCWWLWLVFIDINIMVGFGVFNLVDVFVESLVLRKMCYGWYLVQID